MSRSLNQYIKSIERRLEWVQDRLNKCQDDAQDKSVSYLQAERCALRWALPLLKEIVRKNKETNAKPNTD